jgi:hypothetical protein
VAATNPPRPRTAVPALGRAGDRRAPRAPAGRGAGAARPRAQLPGAGRGFAPADAGQPHRRGLVRGKGALPPPAGRAVDRRGRSPATLSGALPAGFRTRSGPASSADTIAVVTAEAPGRRGAVHDRAGVPAASPCRRISRLCTVPVGGDGVGPAVDLWRSSWRMMQAPAPGPVGRRSCRRSSSLLRGAPPPVGGRRAIADPARTVAAPIERAPWLERESPAPAPVRAVVPEADASRARRKRRSRPPPRRTGRTGRFSADAGGLGGGFTERQARHFEAAGPERYTARTRRLQGVRGRSTGPTSPTTVPRSTSGWPPRS